MRLPSGFLGLEFDTIDSTNDEARRRIRAGELSRESVLVVAAASQTAGRGRQGRHWSSPRGNLHMTLAMPAPAAERRPELAFVAAVAVGEAVSAHLPGGLAVTYKWPNDLLLSGHKVGGILIEAEEAPGGTPWAAVGIGLNITDAPEGLPYAATALAREGVGIAASELIAPICAALRDWRERWRRQGFAPVRANWLAAAHGLGRPVTARLGTGPLEGVFEDIDETGRLVLRTAGERRRIAAAELEFAGV